ncbi:MAG: hypothetical protein ACK4PH_29265, partial [Aquincola tertiaricarbonis]
MSASPEVVPTGPRSTTLALLDGERRVLAQIAAGVPLPQVLEALACELEAGAPVPTKACVLVVAGGLLRVGAAPSLPPAVREALS